MHYLEKKLAIDISNMMYDALEFLINEYHTNSDFEGFKLEFVKLTGMECSIENEKAFIGARKVQLTEELSKRFMLSIRKGWIRFLSKLFLTLKNIYETKSYRYENIAFPITDGVRMMNAIAPIEKSYNTNGKRNRTLSIRKKYCTSPY